MTSKQPTITGELRKWRLESYNEETREGVVIGKMHNDIHDIWEDGEDAVIRFKDWVISVNFCLAVTNHGAIKCPTDEERK